MNVLKLLNASRIGRSLPVAALVLAMGVGAGASAKSVTITWSTFLGGDLLKEQLELIKLFEKENSDIKVKVVSVSDFGKLVAMYASGKPPDVMHTLGDWSDELMRRDMLLDITKYLKVSRFDYSKYIGFSDIYKKSGKVIGGLETHVQIDPLFFNADMVQRAGLPSPNKLASDKTWNWAHFLTYAQKLTADTRGDGRTNVWGFWTTDYYEFGWAPWLTTNDTGFYNAKTNRVTLDDPNAVAAMEFMSSLVTKYRVAPPLGTLSENDFTKGNTAMMFCSSWMLNRLLAMKSSFGWDIVSPPQGLSRGVIMLPGADGVISKVTKHPAEAFRLVNFFLSEPCQMAKARSRLVIPVLRKALDSPAYLASPPAHMALISEMVDYATTMPASFVGYADAMSAMRTEMSRLLQGKKSAALAMKDATLNANKLLAAYEARRKR